MEDTGRGRGTMPGDVVARDVDIWAQLKQLQQRRCAAHRVWAQLFTNLLRGDMSGDQFELAVGQTILNEFRDVSTTVKRVAEDGVLADQRVSAAVQRWAQAVQRAERRKYEDTIGRQQLMIRHLTAEAVHNPNCFLINRVRTDDPSRAMLIRRDIFDPGFGVSDDDDDGSGANIDTAASAPGAAREGCASQQQCHAHDHAADVAALERKGNDCAAAEAAAATTAARLRRTELRLVDLMDELQENLSDA